MKPNGLFPELCMWFYDFFFFNSEIRADQHIAFCGQRCQKGKVIINNLCNGLSFLRGYQNELKHAVYFSVIIWPIVLKNKILIFLAVCECSCVFGFVYVCFVYEHCINSFISL